MYSYAGAVIGVNIFPEVDPEIYQDIDGTRWGMVYMRNCMGELVEGGAMRWFTVEELEEENLKLLNAMTFAMRLLEGKNV